MNASVMAVSAITRRLLPAGSTREAPDPSTALTTARPRLSALLDALLTDPASDEGSM
jgi:hypothetical protein